MNCIRFERDLDHGLEWCENDLIARVAPTVTVGEPVPIVDLLSGILKDRALAGDILPYLDRVEIAVGERLITQGAPSSDMFFIEEGRAAVEVENRDGPNTRLATIGQGTIAGEMAFYGGRPRSASVIAETPLVAWRLSAEQLGRLRRAPPIPSSIFIGEWRRFSPTGSAQPTVSCGSSPTDPLRFGAAQYSPRRNVPGRERGPSATAGRRGCGRRAPR